ncbi:MAG: helix-turn-helix domain-containing protein [Isosphaeraceae bacterium]|nr:helix-turn-helix domain-containing protein [Isosphaeraceae bacterium]
MNLAKRVRDCRYAKGWGPDELASRAEISRTALYQIECGKTGTPRAATLRRLAEALGVPIAALLGEEDRGRLEHANRKEVGREAAGENGGRDLASSRTRSAEGSRVRRRELDRKFHELLASPFGEGIVRIVEESHRLLSSHRD